MALTEYEKNVEMMRNSIDSGSVRRLYSDDFGWARIDRTEECADDNLGWLELGWSDSFDDNESLTCASSNK